MILDPWEFKWSCPDPEWRLKRFECPYSPRYTLPCGTKRTECLTCYMRQQSYSDHYNRMTYFTGQEKVIHVCDRCGQVINMHDLATYFELTDRQGATAIRQELCYDCAMELMEWAEKKGEDD